MELNQYLESIKAVNKLEIENTAIENAMSKLQLSKNKIEFTLEELFQNSKENNEVILNPEVLIKIEKNLNLIFIKEEEKEGNICFANNEEIRSEYKQSFRLADLMDYIAAFANSLFYKEHSKIIITEELSFFWEMVKLGSQLNNQKL